MVYRLPPDATLDELRAQHARAQLYAVAIRTTALWRGPEDEAYPRLLREHFIYLYQLQASGTLFGAGPLLPDDSDDDAVGMLILAAASLEDAQRIAETEPFHQAGWRVNKVRGWIINEGCAASFARIMSELATRPQPE